MPQATDGEAIWFVGSLCFSLEPGQGPFNSIQAGAWSLAPNISIDAVRLQSWSDGRAQQKMIEP